MTTTAPRQGPTKNQSGVVPAPTSPVQCTPAPPELSLSWPCHPTPPHPPRTRAAAAAALAPVQPCRFVCAWCHHARRRARPNVACSTVQEACRSAPYARPAQVGSVHRVAQPCCVLGGRADVRPGPFVPGTYLPRAPCRRGGGNGHGKWARHGPKTMVCVHCARARARARAHLPARPAPRWRPSLSRATFGHRWLVANMPSACRGTAGTTASWSSPRLRLGRALPRAWGRSSSGRTRVRPSRTPPRARKRTS